MTIHQCDDEGMTLVELIVVIVVSGLFIGLLAVMFASGLSEQGRSSLRDRATGSANLLSVSLSQLRNATHATSSPDGTALIATIVSREGLERCYGWSAPGDGTMRHVASSPIPLRFADLAHAGALVALDQEDENASLTAVFATTPKHASADIEITIGEALVGASSVDPITVPLVVTIPTQAVLETEELSQCVAP